jgi:hypothetical protein
MKILEGKETEFQNWKEINSDGYGLGIFKYAEKWADLMEKEIAEGKDVADIAGRTSDEADTEGITGFMYGAAVGILSLCWLYGEKLRVWHNKKYNHEGKGIVNPAILQ